MDEPVMFSDCSNNLFQISRASHQESQATCVLKVIEVHIKVDLPKN